MLVWMCISVQSGYSVLVWMCISVQSGYSVLVWMCISVQSGYSVLVWMCTCTIRVQCVGVDVYIYIYIYIYVYLYVYVCMCVYIFPSQELSRSLDMRVSQYEKFQDNISQRACIYFKHYLQQRDYEGGLTFNHDKEVLKMEVGVCACVCVRVFVHAASDEVVYIGIAGRCSMSECVTIPDLLRLSNAVKFSYNCTVHRVVVAFTYTVYYIYMLPRPSPSY